ncbi:MAG: RdgB/HAM1 family non-canonical purine NTP pyrophosphatase [Paludibacteraceae bacterium]|nr:RdgB/HAM1 family non-canonical purine NTP pyrophosphatase [Paludibacteraceae bacterium]
MKLVFASNNKHKLEEVRQILPTHVEVISLREIGFVQDIDETGTTLEENSALKAREVWNWLTDNSLLDSVDGVFADDTGLEISALGGAPGVRTARWAGDEACDMNNRQKALHELAGVKDRAARFRTVVSLIIKGEMQQVEGIVNGEIAIEEEGDGGFGYDPVFIPEGYNNTFASLSSEEKNAVSHRGRAMEALRKLIDNIG